MMSRRLAGFIYRWRLPLTAVIFLGALASIPRVNITHIDNDITAWFSRDDPVFKDYERLRGEFGGTRSLIVALQADSADRLFARDTLDFIDEITGDIERVSTVQRVVSLATATVVQATPDGGLDVRPLLDDLRRSAVPSLSRDDLHRSTDARPALRQAHPSTLLGVTLTAREVIEPSMCAATRRRRRRSSCASTAACRRCWSPPRATASSRT